MKTGHLAAATSPHASRRVFLRGALGAGTGVGLASVLGACTPAANRATGCTGPATDSDAAPSADATAALDAKSAPCPPAPDTTPAGLIDLASAPLPFRQDDPKWGKDLMWDRKLVIKAAVELNGESKATAEALLRQFPDGNSIGNEGCMLTCLAMVLRLLAPPAKPPWTPKNLNAAAQEAYYYTLSGLSMTTLYADLVAEVSGGAVQLGIKEEYLPGEPGWPPMHPHNSALVRAYRSLPRPKRDNYLLMLKTGTYDDTVASHYVLLAPDDDGAPDQADPLILDPAKPLDQTQPWRLTDSAKAIGEDPEIASAWQAAGIAPTQIGGVWVFVRGRSGHDGSLVAPLIRAWAEQLADGYK